MFYTRYYVYWLAFAGLIAVFTVAWCREMYKRLPDDVETWKTPGMSPDKQIAIALWSLTAVVVLIAAASIFFIVFFILNPSSYLYQSTTPARDFLAR